MRDRHEDHVGGLIEASSNPTSAAEDYPELPLGSNAFISPLHPVSIPPAAATERRRRSRTLLVTLTTLVSAAAVLTLALVLRDAYDPESRVAISAEPEPSETTAPVVKTAAALSTMLAPTPAGSQADAPPRGSSKVVPANKRSEPAVTRRVPTQRERTRGTSSRRKRDKTASVAPREAPSRAAVLSAMRSVTKEARTCLQGSSAVAQVDITFTGKTGAVSAARVRGVSGQAAVCVERAVRQAKLPSFTKSRLDITFPFRGR